MLKRFLEPDDFLALLRSQPRSRLLMLSALLVLVIGMADYVSGAEVAFAVFYLAPVVIAGYFLRDGDAIAIAFAAALTWYVADLTSGRTYSSSVIGVWNGFTRLLIFLIVASLTSAVRRAWQQQHDLAHFDYLTGIANRRKFSEWLQHEISRLRRYGHPFTVAYMDVDNFKMMNDYLGHATGDQLLRIVAGMLRSSIPETDRAARLGGDEFALLLPETDYEAASVLITQLHQTLISEITRQDWPVSFSIGVITCRVAPEHEQALIDQVDELMYKVKRSGKNAIRHEILEG